MCTRITFAVLSGCLMLLTGAAVSAGELAEREAITGKAIGVMFDGDFAAIEGLHRQLLDTMEYTQGGSLKLKLHSDALSDAFNINKEAEGEANYRRWSKQTKDWAEQHPTSAFAHVMHVRALVAYAWYFRGNTFADKVPALAWKPFRKYMQEASAYLTAHADVGRSDPDWFVTALEIGPALGWSNEVLDTIYDDGVRRFPGDYRLHYARLTAVLPKWGGSAEELERFANKVAASAPPGRGMEYYTRMYLGATDHQYGAALYRDSKIDWNKMRHGLDDMYKRFPSSWVQHVYASNACRAGDKASAARMLKGLESDDGIGVWGQGGRVALEQCRRWASRPKAAAAANANGI